MQLIVALQICHLLFGSRVPDRVLLWSCLFLPARGVEELIFATAVAASRRTCHQSTSGHLFKDEVSVYHYWRVLVCPMVSTPTCGSGESTGPGSVLELSVCPGRLDECFPTVREAFLIAISIKTWFLDFLPLSCLLSGPGKTLNQTAVTHRRIPLNQ